MKKDIWGFHHRIQCATKPEDVTRILDEAKTISRVRGADLSWLEDMAEGRIDELVPEKE